MKEKAKDYQTSKTRENVRSYENIIKSRETVEERKKINRTKNIYKPLKTKLNKQKKENDTNKEKNFSGVCCSVAVSKSDPHQACSRISATCGTDVGLQCGGCGRSLTCIPILTICLCVALLLAVVTPNKDRPRLLPVPCTVDPS